MQPVSNRQGNEHDQFKRSSSIAAQVVGFASISSLGCSLMAATGIAAKAPQRSTSTDPNPGARVYNVRDFGAKGDGITLDTAAIQPCVSQHTELL